MTTGWYPSLFPWELYSKKLSSRIEMPFCTGSFSEEEAKEKGLFLASGESGSLSSGNKAYLSWLVDPNDGVILDARFQAYGDSAFLGACEIVSELVVGKNYFQAQELHIEDIDKEARDRADKEAFPRETWGHMTLALEAVDDTASECHHIPLPVPFAEPFALTGMKTPLREGGWPGWEALTDEEQRKIIEQVLDQEVRPSIARDAGGVDLIDVKEGKQVYIAYKGTCATCFSATGTTLSYIQHVLRSHVHPELIVVPQWSTTTPL